MSAIYEDMPECPVLCTGMNGILLVPSPLGERDRVRGKRKNLHPHLCPLPQERGDYLSKQARCPALWAGSFTGLPDSSAL